MNMNILVCIKQGPGEQVMGQFEELALEQGLALKDALLASGLKSDKEPPILDVITAGPDSDLADDMIRRAYGMGADKGIIVRTKTNGLMPAFNTASLLAGAAKSRYDLILTGIMSQDLMAGQTGPMLAELLSIPWAAGVVKVDLLPGKPALRVEQEMDKGGRQVLDISLPALLTIQSGGVPRYPTLSNMLKAGDKPITLLEEAGLCPVPRRETFIAMETPVKTRDGLEIKGNLKDQVDKFYKFLRGKNFI